MIGKVTRIVLSVVIVGLAAWASVAAAVGGELDTVSAHVRDYGHKFPLVPFAAGVLVGHWFWPMGPARKRDE